MFFTPLVRVYVICVGEEIYWIQVVLGCVVYVIIGDYDVRWAHLQTDIRLPPRNSELIPVIE